jgi:hypothetical protein
MHSLTIRVLHNGSPVSKRVGCVHESGPLIFVGTNQSGITDKEGIIRFDNVPDGTTRIYIDGREVDSVYFRPYDPDKSHTINI